MCVEVFSVGIKKSEFVAAGSWENVSALQFTVPVLDLIVKQRKLGYPPLFDC